MADPARLDSDWLRANPVPPPDHATDKNGRGRVLALGGSAQVPGGIVLTAEAVLRAGAGKIRVGTIRSLAVPLGLAMPEAGVIALEQTAGGEIDASALAHEPAIGSSLSHCDALVAGPAMSDAAAGTALVETVLQQMGQDIALVLDAAALAGLEPQAGRLRARPSPAILTPHIGEMAWLLGCEAERIEADRERAAREAADRYGAIVVLKGATTLVAAPDGQLFAYAGGGVGLATGGSGDVQAGLAAGLAARGADPLLAALWAVWLHGEAGRRCAEQIGPLGFLARELLAHVPALLRAV